MTATKAKRPAPIAYPDLLTLSRVDRDIARCNRTIDVWLAQSDTHAHIRYETIHDKHIDTWSCNCPASRSCKHIARAKVLAAARWWEQQLADCTPGELRAMIPGKQAQIDTETDALSAHAALLTIDALLLAADEPLAVAA